MLSCNKMPYKTLEFKGYEVKTQDNLYYYPTYIEPWWMVYRNNGVFEIWELGTEAFGGSDYLYKTLSTSLEDALICAYTEIT